MFTLEKSYKVFHKIFLFHLLSYNIILVTKAVVRHLDRPKINNKSLLCAPAKSYNEGFVIF
jgi:hypothetical protein